MQIPIDGLTNGTSQIASGQRQFSLCWQGGDPPYSVGVSQSANPVVDLKAPNSNEISDAKPVDVAPGKYDIYVRDGVGSQVNGKFTAVPSSQIPGGNQSASTPGEAAGQASALLGQGGTYDYEAYLRLMAAHSKDAETQRILDGICHRAGSATNPSGPALALGGVELVLSSQLGTLDESDPTVPNPVLAYLTKANSFFAEMLYTFDSFSTNGFNSKVQTSENSTNDYQKATSLIAYGITDDWTLGGEVPWSWSTVHRISVSPTSTTDTTNRADPTTDDPTFFTTYRVMNQAAGPGTLFLQSSYSPVVFDGGRSAFDLGAALVRWQSQFAVAVVADASRVGEFTIDGQHITTDKEPYWTGTGSLTVFVPIDTRWAVALSLTDTLANNRNIEFSNSATNTYVYPNTVSVSPSISFQIVPQELCLLVSYSHKFSYTYTTNSAYTNLPGSNVVGVVLSDTGLFDEIARTVN